MPTKSLSPLVENEDDGHDDSTDDDLIVPNHLTDYKVKIDIKKEWSTENENGCSEKPLIHSHKIKGEKEMIVKNALKVGDKVDLLSFNDNKTYYILDRVPKQRDRKSVV